MLALNTPAPAVAQTASVMVEKCDKGRELEVSGIQTVLKAVCCKECGSGPVTFEEDLYKRIGLCTHPYFLSELSS